MDLSLTEAVLEKVMKYWEYPVKSVVMLLHRVLETIMTSLSESQLQSVIRRSAAVSDKHRFRILAEVAVSRGSDVILMECQSILLDCARAYNKMDLTTPACNLLSIILKQQYESLQGEQWIGLWKDILSLPTRLPLQSIIQLDKGQLSVPFILSSQPSFHVLLTVLKTARTMGFVKFTPEGVSVQSLDLPYSKLKEAIGHADNLIVGEAMEFLASTSAGSEPLSEVERRLTLFFCKHSKS
jgi:hypothetical protein